MTNLTCRYILYKFFSPHRLGFGIHSPFVFQLVSRILSKKDDENLIQIKEWRYGLIRNTSILETSDVGAGSKIHKSKERSIRQIAGKSSIRHKFGRVLYALAKEFKPATIIELGTGIGISTAYLAKGCPVCRVFSIEGDTEKINFAAKSLEQLELKNVTLINGIFKDLLPGLLTEAVHPVMVFVDGDHSYSGTMVNFAEIIKSLNHEIIVVLDDIRWSKDMERAWNDIKLNPAVTVSIDLFFMGIVFFRSGITKQDFVINF
jgi:predicted O-methyltransferase YrrM